MCATLEPSLPSRAGKIMIYEGYVLLFMSILIYKNYIFLCRKSEMMKCPFGPPLRVNASRPSIIEEAGTYCTAVRFIGLSKFFFDKRATDALL